MDLNKFNSNSVNKLLENITRENKTTFLLGDLNLDLLKYESHPSTDEFLDSLSFNMILPYILHPTRINDHFRTLIGNIFSNHISKEAICGDLRSTIPDHLPQFFIMLSIFQTLFHPNAMSMKEIGQISIKKSLYWTILKKAGIYIEKDGVNHSFDNFLLNMNGLLNKHAPCSKGK